MRILVSGSTGLVGTELINALERDGHDVLRLVRQRGQFNEPQIGWNPEKGLTSPAERSQLEKLDAVIHLAGENIAAGRWSDNRKKRIRDSRVHGTRQLAELIASLDNPPKTFISVSATGYYGDRGSEPLTEVAGEGKGFLARVCREWENAAAPAAAKGIRVVHPRFGVILSNKGGALKAMEWPFRLGLAGNLGNGKQYFPWIALPDVIGALEHVLAHDELAGPINFVAPDEVTNAQFTDTMRKVLIPGFLPMHYWTPPAPALAVRLLVGEMGDALLLASQRVKPVRLQASGYEFKYPTLRQAIESQL